MYWSGGGRESAGKTLLKPTMLYAALALALLTPICALAWCFLRIEVQMRREDGAFIKSQPKISIMMSLAQAELMVGNFQPEPIASRRRSQEHRSFVATDV